MLSHSTLTAPSLISYCPVAYQFPPERRLPTHRRRGQAESESGGCSHVLYTRVVVQGHMHVSFALMSASQMDLRNVMCTMHAAKTTLVIQKQ